MTRWFADLPIERKLRIVITVPAMAAFAIAMIMHIATNLLHLRADMQQRAAGIARASGVSAIEALRLGETSAAINALNALRDEPMVNVAEVYLPDGQKLATFDRATNDVQLEQRDVGSALRSEQHAVSGARTIPSHGPGDARRRRAGVCAYPHAAGGALSGLARLCADHPGGDRGRGLGFLLAFCASAEADFRAHRQPGAYHAAGLDRGGLQLRVERSSAG